MTVIDQERPWLTPSSTFAPTIHSQVGAQIIRNGTGRPTAHPTTSVFLRPQVSASWPETRLVTALTTPKLMMNEVTATVEASWKVSLPISGTSVRSSPTMPPTKALMTTRRLNCCQFWRSPRAMRGCAAAARASVASTTAVIPPQLPAVPYSRPVSLPLPAARAGCPAT